jgi:hypothetical protein
MEKLLDSKKVRALLGEISSSTLDRLSQLPGFPAAIQHRRRGKRFWSESSLLYWIERNRSPPYPNIESPETPAKVKRRFKNACADLKGLGIKLTRHEK